MTGTSFYDMASRLGVALQTYGNGKTTDRFRRACEVVTNFKEFMGYCMSHWLLACERRKVRSSFESFAKSCTSAFSSPHWRV